jgi:hypothetical protein
LARAALRALLGDCAVAVHHVLYAARPLIFFDENGPSDDKIRAVNDRGRDLDLALGRLRVAVRPDSEIVGALDQVSTALLNTQTAGHILRSPEHMKHDVTAIERLNAALAELERRADAFYAVASAPSVGGLLIDTRT